MTDLYFEQTDDNRLLPSEPPEKSAQEVLPFVTAYLEQWEKSPQRKFMDVCERYYNNKNDIFNKERTIIGKDDNNTPILVKAELLANNHLSHNFLQKLTKQKLGYIISKPFTIDPDNPDDGEAKEMITAIKPYYTKNFHKMVKNCARDAVVNGLGWVQVYYDEKGELGFKRIPSKEVAPIWGDIDHTELNGVIRKYDTNDYTSGQMINTTHVEYYTKDRVYYYIYGLGKGLYPDTTRFVNAVGPQYFGAPPDDGYTASNSVLGLNWGKVPFIPFKYNSEETTLLSKIKELIDEYDNKTSHIANMIDDIPNSFKVIKNYDGKNKEEFVYNMNQLRTLFVQGDGDASTLESPLNVTEIDVHLQRLREDIYEFGQGVNTADKDIRDTSGVALRFMYADLDMDCNDWSPELETSIMSMIEFIQKDIEAKTQKDYSDVQYSILFNTDVIINETETITNAFTSKGIISDATIAANHPWTRDVDKELDNMHSEDVDELKLEQQYGNKPKATMDNQIRSSGTVK